MNNDKPQLVDGKTVEHWDLEWVKVPGGLSTYQPQYRYLVGLYRVTLRGEIVAIGKGTDKSGGLSKRLSDFGRTSRRGRDHYAGRRIYEHLDEVELEVLITGERHEPWIAQSLKKPMIDLHKPAWTVPARCRPAFKSARKTKSKKAGPNTKMSPYTGPIPSLAPPSEIRENPA